MYSAIKVLLEPQKLAGLKNQHGGNKPKYNGIHYGKGKPFPASCCNPDTFIFLITQLSPGFNSPKVTILAPKLI